VTVARIVEVDRVPVHFVESGDGPAVLLLHGSGPGTTGASAWAATVEALADSWRLVAPDHAGYGRTPLPAGSRGGLRDWTDLAAGLMASLGHETYSVVGHSMGGAVALSLAATRPARVNRVVAVSTMGAPEAGLSEALEAVWAAAPGRQGAREMLSRLFHDQAWVTDEAVDTRAAAMEAGAPRFASMFPPPRARWAEDLTLSPDLLGAIRAPVLLAHGAEDRVTPLETSAIPLLRHLADVRLHVFGGCGHVPAVEHAAEFLGLVREFLRLAPPGVDSRPRGASAGPGGSI
jgi:2-hydroxymuconate-semialdehyde hydrolase